jgi:hypothetical protein
MRIMAAEVGVSRSLTHGYVSSAIRSFFMVLVRSRSEECRIR